MPGLNNDINVLEVPDLFSNLAHVYLLQPAIQFVESNMIRHVAEVFIQNGLQLFKECCCGIGKFDEGKGQGDDADSK